ncbi:4,5-DOPA dioxygenase extradiol [Flavobacterium chuncheonense]|uniref:4,5-DOPA dioxygenase extradiol n=1 Tax=Flavobacterium chuncheonense TaxID=2026653 RepID=A0ABW5YJW7_9FLAO
MQRSDFIKIIASGVVMGNINPFYNWSKDLKEGDLKYPVLFIGHGSPMNAIEDNEFSKRWKKLGQEIPKPKAVVVVSAHWLTKGTHVTAMPNPKTIHDFGGFPKPLYEVQYKAPGAPQLADEIKQMVSYPVIGLDHEWGLDHGTWSVVKHMYPNADIPIMQLSIDYSKPTAYHYEVAKQLLALRKKGVLIIGSGNMVHNLRMVAWDKLLEPEYGFDWALEMNAVFKQKILLGNHDELINYERLHREALKAIPSPDHYLPLIYSLALQDQNDEISFFNDKAVGGSLTMTSVKIG